MFLTESFCFQKLPTKMVCDQSCARDSNILVNSLFVFKYFLLSKIRRKLKITLISKLQYIINIKLYLRVKYNVKFSRKENSKKGHIPLQIGIFDYSYYFLEFSKIFKNFLMFTSCVARANRSRAPLATGDYRWRPDHSSHQASRPK